jgi:hypothetical protein
MYTPHVFELLLQQASRCSDLVLYVLVPRPHLRLGLQVDSKVPLTVQFIPNLRAGSGVPLPCELLDLPLVGKVAAGCHLVEQDSLVTAGVVGILVLRNEGRRESRQACLLEQVVVAALPPRNTSVGGGSVSLGLDLTEPQLEPQTEVVVPVLLFPQAGLVGCKRAQRLQSTTTVLRY